jgi:lysophospholipase L1-like esterase
MNMMINIGAAQTRQVYSGILRFMNNSILRLLPRPVRSIILACCSLTACAQEPPPFFQDIQQFKQQDKLNPPPQNAILFVGSSSFTKWTDVQHYFPDYKIINRGFGGSSLKDVIRYANDIIISYKPKQVVIYCGDNDFAGNEQLTPAELVERVKQLFFIIRKGLPGANITYISIKPSPSRSRFMQKEEIANKDIQQFLATQKNTGFVDVYHLMLNDAGKPIPSIFLEDSLHMNGDGYAIWKKALQPVLKK